MSEVVFILLCCPLVAKNTSFYNLQFNRFSQITISNTVQHLAAEEPITFFFSGDVNTKNRAKERLYIAVKHDSKRMFKLLQVYQMCKLFIMNLILQIRSQIFPSGVVNKVMLCQKWCFYLVLLPPRGQKHINTALNVTYSSRSALKH